jgi:histone H3/H4
MLHAMIRILVPAHIARMVDHGRRESRYARSLRSFLSRRNLRRVCRKAGQYGAEEKTLRSLDSV